MTTEFSACEADTVSLSYTPCYEQMARQCHEARYVVADRFTNMLVFFMSDYMKAVSPVFDRIPKELQEQYMTDLVTEYRKAHENTDDRIIPLKYGLIVAFARK